MGKHESEIITHESDMGVFPTNGSTFIHQLHFFSSRQPADFSLRSSQISLLRPSSSSRQSSLYCTFWLYIFLIRVGWLNVNIVVGHWAINSIRCQCMSYDSSGVYICKSIVNYLRHGNYICKSGVECLSHILSRFVLLDSKVWSFF